MCLTSDLTFFDTANCYAHGTSEEFWGNAIKNNIARDKVVLASKVYFNDGHLSKNAVNREIDGTLKRLGTDYLDLYTLYIGLITQLLLRKLCRHSTALLSRARFVLWVRLPCTDTNSTICRCALRTTDLLILHQ